MKIKYLFANGHSDVKIKYHDTTPLLLTITFVALIQGSPPYGAQSALSRAALRARAERPRAALR